MSRLIPRVGRIGVAARPKDCVVLARVFSAPERGELLGLVLRINRPWLTTAQIAQQVVMNLKRAFEEQESTGPLRFERIVRGTNELLASLAHSGEASWLGHLDGAMLYLSGTHLSATNSGAMAIWLARAKQLSPIAAPKSAEGAASARDLFEDLVSGELLEGDLVLVMPADIERLIPEAELVEYLGFPARVAIRQIARPLMKARLQNLAGLVLELRDAALPFEDDGLPEVIYLDQPLESTLSVIRRFLGPILRSSQASAVVLTRVHLPKLTARGKAVAASTSASLTPRLTRLIARGEEAGRLVHERLLPWRGVGLRVLFSAVRSLAESQTLARQRARIWPLALQVGQRLDRLGRPVSQALERFESRFEAAWLGREPPERTRLLLPLLALILILITVTQIKAVQGRRERTRVQVRAEDVARTAEQSLERALEDMSRKSPEAAQAAIETGLIAINQLPLAEQAGRIAQLKTALEEQYDILTGSVRLRSPRATYDFETEVQAISLFEGSLVATGSTPLLRFHPLTGSEAEPGQPLPEGLGQPKLLERSSRELVIVTEGGRVLTLSRPTGRAVEAPLLTADQTVGQPLAIGSFGPHLYLLLAEGQIYRLPRLETGFGDRIPFIEHERAKPKQPVDLAIDGFIYVLERDGSITKYLKGVPQTDFSLRAIPSPHGRIAEPRRVVTDGDSNALYVLDGGTAQTASPPRVVELAKDGKFTRQYLLPAYGPVDLIVNEKARTMWVLYGDRVLEFSL